MTRLLAVKAEVVVGFLLVARHRGVRLAAVLVGVLLVSTRAGESSGSPVRLALVVGGTLAAVGASRLLAPGAALLAARRAAAPWWIPPAGRLAGCLIVAFAAAALAPVVAPPPVSPGAGAASRAVLAAALQITALGSLVLALAPVAGASAAALGLMAAWLGGIPPSSMAAALSPWPLVARPAVWAWNALPLSWRAERWLAAGTATDLVVLGAWIAAGVTLAARALGAPGSGRGSRGDGP